MRNVSALHPALCAYSPHTTLPDGVCSVARQIFCSLSALVLLNQSLVLGQVFNSHFYHLQKNNKCKHIEMIHLWMQPHFIQNS